MCFSAKASFTLGALLISTGIFSTITAKNSNKNYIFLALIPIFFGIQQVIEGIIWLQMYGDKFTGSSFWVYFYLFFAFYFWPAFIPLCSYRIEQNTTRKKVLAGFLLAGIILGAIIYVPILLGVISTKAMVMGQCIQYDVHQSITLSSLYTIFYLFIITMSLLISSIPKIKLLGIVILISANISYWWYFHAFTSTWCFFAAAISIYIAYIVYRLPIKPN